MPGRLSRWQPHWFQGTQSHLSHSQTGLGRWCTRAGQLHSRLRHWQGLITTTGPWLCMQEPGCIPNPQRWRCRWRSKSHMLQTCLMIWFLPSAIMIKVRFIVKKLAQSDLGSSNIYSSCKTRGSVNTYYILHSWACVRMCSFYSSFKNLIQDLRFLNTCMNAMENSKVA